MLAADSRGGASASKSVGSCDPEVLAATGGDECVAACPAQGGGRAGKFLLAVGRLQCHAFHFGAMQAQVKQLAIRQTGQFAQRLAVDAIAAAVLVQAGQKGLDAVKKGRVRADNRIHFMPRLSFLARHFPCCWKEDGIHAALAQ